MANQNLSAAWYSHVVLHADMLSADMVQEQSRRNWEEESKRRYELEQLAEQDREQRVEVTFQLHCTSPDTRLQLFQF